MILERDCGLWIPYPEVNGFNYVHEVLMNVSRKDWKHKA